MNEKNGDSRKKKKLKDVRSKFPGITLDSTPTDMIFATHPSFTSGANFPDILQWFREVESNCSFYIFPQQQHNYKDYVFVGFEDVDSAVHVFDKLNGIKPKWLGKSAMPVELRYASNFTLRRDVAELPGFSVINDAISLETEQKLVEFIDSCTPSEVLKHRSVIHFGHRFDYGTNTAMKPTSPIPKLLFEVLNELRASGIPIKIEADQVTINSYEPGQGIPSHVDTHSAFENQILWLNLLSDIVIRFKDCANNATVIDQLMPRRSVTLMEDSARYKYKHGILTRRYDSSPVDNRLIERGRRISITFRQVRRKPCECAFLEFCDWGRGGFLNLPKDDSKAAHLENKYVSSVYENIAEHFDSTRFSLWPAFTNFMKSLPRWSVLLDAGCGNGKYLTGDFDLIRIGSDLSHNLVRIASRKAFSVFRADLLSLPVRSNSIDGVICAAVVHHFSTLDRRLRAFREIARVLRIGGRALVSGWSMDQGGSYYQKMRANRANEEEEEEETKDSAPLDKLTVHDGTVFTQQDMLVPWDSGKKSSDKQFLRYYHLFVEGEMDNLVEQIGGCKLLRSFKEQGNFFVEFEKCYC